MATRSDAPADRCGFVMDTPGVGDRLDGATLRGADLGETDLRRASLRDADASGASFRDAP